MKGVKKDWHKADYQPDLTLPLEAAPTDPAPLTRTATPHAYSLANSFLSPSVIS